MKPLPRMEPNITLRTWLKGHRNWVTYTYVNGRGIRHRDPYLVLAMKPLSEKTAPTYNDIMAFIDSMLAVERTNDERLNRHPQAPKLAKIVKRILKEHGF